MRIALVFVMMVLGQVALAADLPTATVERATLPQRQWFDGVIEAVNQATVSAQTSGRITAINFDVDDYVERGSVLVQLRDTEQQAQLRQAQAAVDEARARLNEARDEYNRIKDIYAKKLVAKSAMDKATAELNAAKARMDRAQGALESAREQLDYTRIRAPYSGIVVERHVEVGETASPGEPLMTGISLEQLRAVVSVPQRYVQEVRALRQASVKWGVDETNSVQSERITVYPYADEASHGFRVRVNLPESDSYGLYPGMLVKVGFVTGRQDVLTIPRSAVVHRSELTGVYVVDQKGRIQLRQIRTGYPYAGERIGVVSGLTEGERVVVDPVLAVVELKRRQTEAQQ